MRSSMFMCNLVDNLDQSIRDLIEVDSPDWAEGGRVHNWRNHVRSEVKELWPELTLESRYVAYLMAEEVAMSEEWD